MKLRNNQITRIALYVFLALVSFDHHSHVHAVHEVHLHARERRAAIA
jgi:hypothetical protein